jgi:hypothetical protein
MVKLYVRAENLAKTELKNPVVVRTLHTAWQAALGAAVASFSGTHGDIRAAILVGVAAAAAAVKTAIFGKNTPVLVVTPVTSQPAAVIVVDPTTPASPPVS